MMGHAMALATIQGIAKLDFKDFHEDAAANAEAVSGLSGFVIRKHVAATN